MAEEKTIVNLTPHKLNMHVKSGVKFRDGRVFSAEVIGIYPSGTVARVEMTEAPDLVVETEGGDWTAEVQLVVFWQVVGFPEAQEGHYFVVSSMVEALVDRDDVFAPGELIRDTFGAPIGCNGLKQTKQEEWGGGDPWDSEGDAWEDPTPPH